MDGVKRVLSLTNLMDVEGQHDEVNIRPLVPENLEQFNPGDLRLRLQSNPLLEKQFISKDLRTTSILVFLENFEHAKALSQGRFITQQVHEILDPLRQHAEVYGVCRRWSSSTTNMIDDLKVFTPLTLILVVGLSRASAPGVVLRCPGGRAGRVTWILGPMAFLTSLTITTLTLPRS
jgi:hypothetical protein